MHVSFAATCFVVLCHTALRCGAHWCDPDHIMWGDDGESVRIPVGCGKADDEAINLSFSQLGSRAVEILAKALQKSQAKRLILEGNQIGYRGAAALAALVARNTHLQSLDLSQNKIGDEGAILIADAMRNNTRLRKLMLGDNGIGPRGVAAVALAVGNGKTWFTTDGTRRKERQPTNKHLDSVWLSYNPIGDAGGVVLGAVLSGNTTLGDDSTTRRGDAGSSRKLPGIEKVYLAHCKIGNFGAAALGSGLVDNPYITHLVLTGNPIEKKLREPIEAVMNLNIDARRRKTGKAKPSRGRDFNSGLWKQYFAQEQSKAHSNTEVPVFEYGGSIPDGGQSMLSWRNVDPAPTPPLPTAEEEEGEEGEEEVELPRRPVREILTGHEADELDDVPDQSSLPHLVEQRQRIEKAKALDQVPAPGDTHRAAAAAAAIEKAAAEVVAARRATTAASVDVGTSGPGGGEEIPEWMS